MHTDPARWIVVIPAKDEQLRIPRALQALDRAARGVSEEVNVLVYANNCTDGTAMAAGHTARSAHLNTVVEERRLPDALAHAGGARRAAVEAARRVFGARDRDRLFSTDADAIVPEDGLRTAGAAFAAGADVVLARIACLADPAEPAPQTALRRRARIVLWRRHVREVVEWLRTGQPASELLHGDHGAAGIAATFSAYDEAGGFPPVPSEEDRSFVGSADALGLRVDRSSGFAVRASTRVTGRALGGMADLLHRDAASADPGLVERHDLTLERLCAGPCHARAFVQWPAALEPADRAIAGLEAFLAQMRAGRAA
ncbi:MULTISPECIES: hypothetical protein [unclassified Roseitalea]|uniref:hypothetical protein n=1 Tax=unclassified Roseitalea TaxID=2639107 RepID=UPI00273D32D8|nr:MULTISPECIES: hypothetical protein [unclassified Roseitalea]